jgi:hypothetical protein
MDIYEALEKLDGMLDYLIDMAGSGCTPEDIDLIGECEDVIYQFARKYGPQEELPLEFTCTCGEHIVRHDIHGGMSRFFCSKCEAEWLVGPQEV